MAIAASIKEFLLSALREEQRLDGRRPFDFRRLSIEFASEDGAAEVQLGQTRVICNVSCQLVQPSPDEPNEGTLVIYTEFSPMADPTFEAGRPGEIAVELGRIIDRGLRESRAIDTESLCVLSGKAVWALRIDISIFDNGGNLIDAASIAALAALLSFRIPECSIMGTERQDVVVHPPEVREPLPLIIHYLPIAFTFGFFGDGELVVLDPSYKEELVMRGRLTVTLDVQGDICAIQKGGGVGVTCSDILRCLRIASTKVADITTYLKKEAEAHDLERTQRKIKRHQKLSGVEVVLLEDVKISRSAHARHGLHKINGSLGSSDSDLSSVESTDDSVSSDEEKATIGFKKGMRTTGQARHPRKQPVFPLWKDADETSSGGPIGQRAEMLGKINGHSVSEELSTLVSEKLPSLGIRTSGKVASIEGGPSSSSKSKPLSLLDAVKWNNVKRTRAV